MDAARPGLVAAALVMIALGACSGENFGGDRSGGKECSIEFPEGWKTSMEGSAIVALAPFEDDSDPFQEAIGVIIEERDEETTLDKFAAEILRERRAETPSLKVIGESSAKIDDTDAKVLVCDYSEPGGEIREMNYLVVKGKIVAVISCSSQPHKFDQYRPMFEKTAKSFKFE